MIDSWLKINSKVTECVWEWTRKVVLRGVFRDRFAVHVPALDWRQKTPFPFFHFDFIYDRNSFVFCFKSLWADVKAIFPQSYCNELYRIILRFSLFDDPCLYLRITFKEERLPCIISLLWHSGRDKGAVRLSACQGRTCCEDEG